MYKHIFSPKKRCKITTKKGNNKLFFFRIQSYFCLNISQLNRLIFMLIIKLLRLMDFKKHIFSISFLLLATLFISSCETENIEDTISLENEKEVPTYKTSKDELEER